MFCRYGIRCNCVLPGTIDSPMRTVIEAIDKDYLSRVTGAIALQRVGKPQGNSSKYIQSISTCASYCVYHSCYSICAVLD